MKTVYIYRAQDTGSLHIKPVKIKISGPIPNQGSLKEHEIRFQTEGQLLFETLRDALPGGTLDQLTVELLKYKASHFVVRF